MATVATLPTPEQAAAAAVHEGWIRALGARAPAMGEGPSAPRLARGRRRAIPGLLLHLCSPLRSWRAEVRCLGSIAAFLSDRQVPTG